MLKNSFYNELDFLNQISKNYFINFDVKEIRLIKVLKRSKLDFVKTLGICSLFFLSNDWIDYNENKIIEDSIKFYSIKGEFNSIIIVCILTENNYNRTKNEKLIFIKRVNNFLYKSLISKHNLKWEKQL